MLHRAISIIAYHVLRINIEKNEKGGGGSNADSVKV